MLRPQSALPEKLKNDAILEAILELRFQTTTIPEVLLGRLVDHPNWKGLKQARMPAYDVPAQIRDADPVFKFAPVLQMVFPDSAASLRIGASVLSFHKAKPYGQWSEFRPNLERAIDSVFEIAENLQVQRIGLRYLNALSKVHHVKSLADLNLKLTVAGQPIENSVNVNYTISVGENSLCTVRLATRDLVQGLPEDAFLLVDVDVYTKTDFSTTDKAVVKQWVDAAHAQEKGAFFCLFSDDTIQKLKEK